MQNYEEMTQNQIISFLNNENVCVLSVSESNQPHTMPMFYTCTYENEKFTFFFKNLNSTQKIEWIKNNEKVCIQLYNQNWNSTDSIIAIGKAKIIEEENTNNIKVEIDSITGRRYYAY